MLWNIYPSRRFQLGTRITPYGDACKTTNREYTYFVYHAPSVQTQSNFLRGSAHIHSGDLKNEILFWPASTEATCSAIRRSPLPPCRYKTNTAIPNPFGNSRDRNVRRKWRIWHRSPEAARAAEVEGVCSLSGIHQHTTQGDLQHVRAWYPVVPPPAPIRRR